MLSNYIHLHLHSEYSISDSIVRINSLIEKAYEYDMPSVAVTDKNNMFAMVKFYKKAIDNGIKPILGVDLNIESLHSPKSFSAVVLCKNLSGYKNLSRIITNSYSRLNQSKSFSVSLNDLQKYKDGLIILSGGVNGELSDAIRLGKKDAIEDIISFWSKNFQKNFYLEISRTGNEFEDAYNEICLEMAKKFNIPLIATNDVRFIEKSEYQAHEVRVCINEGSKANDENRKSPYTPEQFFKNSKEMEKLFSDIPEALENSIEISKRCNVCLPLSQVSLPVFPVEENVSENELLKSRAHASLKVIMTKKSVSNTKPYTERLDQELDVISKMGYSGYFLIVSDFVVWAKKNNIPVGPGRGSGAGSLVAYVMEITNIDPLKYDLLFERFLNPERISLPDFDIDFCMERRDEVIDYVSKKYGKDRVSQIITFGTMSAKAVVRDVGRVLNYPYTYVDSVAKLIPNELGITLNKALQDKDFKKSYRTSDDVKDIVDMSVILEGLPRNPSTHAGGVVISPTDIIDYTPLYKVSVDNPTITQLDKDDVESMGLIKFDFLGLRTLTVLDKTIKNINEKIKHVFNIDEIPLDDKETFKLLQNRKTVAVFQLESRGLQDIIKRLKPDKFDDLVALVALYRPGPLQSGMVDDFIERKNGAEIHYLHPSLIEILKPTYGVILYQEQVMQIAQILAGYSLGSADILRRAMGKKKPEEMEKQREIFVQGSIKNNVDQKVAEHIFDLMEKFAGYGFNKSHSVAYAMLAYQTAYLKTHYKNEFMAAVLSSDMDDTDKVVRFINEAKKLSVKIIQPSINKSDYEFKVVDDDTICFGLGAVKGVGSAAISNISKERKKSPFKDFSDFILRCDTQKVNKKVLEALIKSGSFDELNLNRAELMDSLISEMKTSEQNLRNQELGQQDIFGFDEINYTECSKNQIEMWDDQTKLFCEKEVLGFYFSGHPADKYKNEIKSITGSNLHKIQKAFLSNKYKTLNVRVAGFIDTVRVRNSSNGKLASIVLSDGSGVMDVICSYDLIKGEFKKTDVLVLSGNLRFDDYSGRVSFRASEISTLEDIRQTEVKKIILNVKSTKSGTDELIRSIKSTFSNSQKSNCNIGIKFTKDIDGQKYEQIFEFPDNYKIEPNNDTIKLIEKMDHVLGLEFIYKV